MWTNTQRTSEHSRSPAAWPCPQLWGLRRAKWRVAILERSPRSLTMLPQVLLTSARDLERENREEGRTLPRGCLETVALLLSWTLQSINDACHPFQVIYLSQLHFSSWRRLLLSCLPRTNVFLGERCWAFSVPSAGAGPGWVTAPLTLCGYRLLSVARGLRLGAAPVCAGLLIRRPIQARSRWLFQLPEQCVVSKERGTLGTTERCHCVCVTLFHLWTAALKVSENQTEKMFCCCCLKKSFQTNPESVL